METSPAVTTGPRPRSPSPQKAEMGATGGSTIAPYRIKSQSVSDRRSRGPVFAPLSLSKPFSFWGIISDAIGSNYLNRFKSDNSAHSWLWLQQLKFRFALRHFSLDPTQFLASF